MDSKYFQHFKGEFVLISTLYYQVVSVTADGLMLAQLLDKKGCSKPGVKPREFDLKKMKLPDVIVIGPQPGWAC
jgi:hypothetical protein